MKLEFSRQFLKKYSDIKLNENPSSRSRVIPYGQTDMTKLIVAVRNFANAPKNQPVHGVWENNRCLFSDPYKTNTRSGLNVRIVECSGVYIQ
jgi:hypothetical protein